MLQEAAQSVNENSNSFNVKTSFLLLWIKTNSCEALHQLLIIPNIFIRQIYSFISSSFYLRLNVSNIIMWNDPNATFSIFSISNENVSPLPLNACSVYEMIVIYVTHSSPHKYGNKTCTELTISVFLLQPIIYWCINLSQINVKSALTLIIPSILNSVCVSCAVRHYGTVNKGMPYMSDSCA